MEAEVEAEVEAEAEAEAEAEVVVPLRDAAERMPEGKEEPAASSSPRWVRGTDGATMSNTKSEVGLMHTRAKRSRYFNRPSPAAET